VTLNQTVESACHMTDRHFRTCRAGETARGGFCPSATGEGDHLRADLHHRSWSITSPNYGLGRSNSSTSQGTDAVRLTRPRRQGGAVAAFRANRSAGGAPGQLE